MNVPHPLTTKDAKGTKKYCRKKYFTEERPVLSKKNGKHHCSYPLLIKDRKTCASHFFSFISSQLLRSLGSLYYTYKFVFSVYSVVNLFYAVYNNKIYYF